MSFNCRHNIRWLSATLWPTQLKVSTTIYLSPVTTVPDIPENLGVAPEPNDESVDSIENDCEEDDMTVGKTGDVLDGNICLITLVKFSDIFNDMET